MDNLMNFTGRNVLVTGASRGIGRSIARLFAERGAKVAVHYNTNRKEADKTLESLSGSGHLSLSADLSDPQAVERLVQETIQAVGKIDVLVNNAGIYEEHPITETDYRQWQEAWHRILGTNLLGPANLMHCVVQQMKKQGGGRIVNVSSRGAFRGEPDVPAYGASKAGLNSLSQSLAKALGGQGIYVFVVAPGFVETEMAHSYLCGPKGDFIRNESPLGRVARPEEVARTVVFLASEGSEFLTGCIVDVNGASYLRT